jgi:hypothetical protein
MAVNGKVVYTGVLGASEVFAFGWSFQDDTATTVGSLASPCVAWITTLFANAPTGAGQAWLSEVKVTAMRLVQYNASGGTADSFTQTVGPLQGSGSASNTQLPYEVACCVTLRGTTAGRRGRGRFYLPPMHAAMLTTTGGSWGVTVTSTGTATVLGTLGTAFASFVSATRRVCVASKVGGTLVMNPVNTVEIGNVPDAQRRRRNRLVEARTSLPI